MATTEHRALAKTDIDNHVTPVSALGRSMDLANRGQKETLKHCSTPNARFGVHFLPLLLRFRLVSHAVEKQKSWRGEKRFM